MIIGGDRLCNLRVGWIFHVDNQDVRGILYDIHLGDGRIPEFRMEMQQIILSGVEAGWTLKADDLS
jgi:hypothetical protein